MAITSRNKAGRLAAACSDRASRAPARPASATAMSRSTPASSSVLRAYRAARPGTCSANVVFAQAGSSQNSRRTRSRMITRCPPIAASASRRSWRLCPRRELRPHAGHTTAPAPVQALMHSNVPASSTRCTTTLARWGTSTPRSRPCWQDKHLLPCDNDKLDSWLTGWRRQPPIYQESLHFQQQHADHGSAGQSHRPQARQAVCRPGLVTVTKCGPDPFLALEANVPSPPTRMDPRQRDRHGVVPVFTANRSALPRQHRHGYAAGFHRGFPSGTRAGLGAGHPHRTAVHRTPGPYPPDLSPCHAYGALPLGLSYTA
jgi:hypothetical protein